MADSGTYDQATITRRQKIAEQMLAESSKPRVIRNPIEGLGYLANTGADAFALNRLDKQAGEARKADTAALMSILNGGGAAPSPTAVASPSPSPAPAMPAPSPAVLDASGPAKPDAQGVYGSDAVMMPPAQPDFGKAIAGIESGGRYDATGPVTKTGDQAYGKYQVMGANIPAWTKEHIGREMSPQEFLASPEAQDAVFKGQFGKYAQAYGPEGAARAWFAGPGGMNDPGRSDQLGTTVQSYGDQFTKNMGGPGAVAAAMSPSAALPPPNAPAAPVPQPASPRALPTNQPTGIPDQQKRAIAALMMATPGSPAQQLGIQLAGQALKPHDYTFQTLPDGTILRLDPTGKTPPQAVYQAPVKPQFTQIGEGAFGDKQFGFINPATQTITPAAGNAATSTGGVPGADSSFLAKGVGQVDHTLKGKAYLDQFAPEIQSSVNDYLEGRSMPTGNPRKGFTQAVEMIARKYGNDIGRPADAASFGQRRQMLNDLARTTPGSLGGQINFAGTSLEHLLNTAEKINDLNNSSGVGIAPIAKLVNMGRQLTTDQAGKANAVNGAAQHYGQEVTKFYSGSPGGEAERNRFMQALDTHKSPTELADALQTERDLIPGRLDQLATQVRTTLGDDSQEGKRWLGRIEEAKKAIPKIDEQIAKLRGQKTGVKPNVPARPSRDEIEAEMKRRGLAP